MASVLDEERLRRVLARMLNEDEFFSAFGVRSLSRQHDRHPFTFPVGGQEYRVSYLPAESDNGMFGGNSNWRGPIWMPVNALIIRALLQYHSYYGDAFKIECPTGSGHLMTLFEVAEELGRRLGAIFLRDEHGRRPLYGGTEKFQSDPHWRDYLQFFEYFHADNGAGLGANHQTGWTGVIARVMHLFATVRANDVQRWSERNPMAGKRESEEGDATRVGTAPYREADITETQGMEEPQPALVRATSVSAAESSSAK